MATTKTWRPSALAAACSPFTHVVPAFPLGQPAVSIQVRTAPTASLTPATAGAPKINNYIGIIAAAAAEGAATSLKTSAQRVYKVQDDMVKGGDARGIPPRGTPV